MDNHTIDFQNQKQEESIKHVRAEFHEMSLELDRLKEEHKLKDMALKQKQMDVQRK